MGLYDDLMKKVTDAAKKTAPVIKDVSGKAAAYAQEKSPIIKTQALQAIEDAKKYRADLKLKAQTNSAAKEEYQRVMYDTALPPEHPDFVDEPFKHYDTELNFRAVTAEVIDSSKKVTTNLFASSNAGDGSGDGFLGADSHGSTTVFTSTQTFHTFWIRNGDIEESFVVDDDAIPLRKGQLLTLIAVGRPGQDIGVMCALYNHNTQTGYYVLTPEVINEHLRIYTELPGMFNGKAVRERRERLHFELRRRMDEMCHWASVNRGLVTNFTLDTQ
jgi:hypothetical protein